VTGDDYNTSGVAERLLGTGRVLATQAIKQVTSKGRTVQAKAA